MTQLLSQISTGLLRRSVHILMVVILAVGFSVSSASQSEAGRSGRIIAGAIIGGIAAAAIIGAHRRHHHHGHYHSYAYAGVCYRGPRRCVWRRHCRYNRWGERRCHRHRKCWRPLYCD